MGEYFMLDVINQCNVDIASDIDIKELATVDTVTFTAGSNTVALPSDFHKNLDFGKNTSTNRNLIVIDSRRLIDRNIEKTTRTGNVMVACNDFPNIYYQYSPSSDQTGSMYYHKLPTDLTLTSEFPAYIPTGQVFRIFNNYILAQMYDVIEDGVEGEKVNTLHHMDQYTKALADFKLFIGPDPDLPDNMDKQNLFFDFKNY